MTFNLNTVALETTAAARKAGTTFGICPVCADIHRLTARGAMVRHGFSAKNVRHGHSGGFHIGGHSGSAPVGTEAGNRKALAEANGHRDVAQRLECLPAVSRDDASLAARQDMLASVRKSVAGSWGQHRVAAMAITLPTEDEVRTDRRWVSCRAWIEAGYLTSRMGRMTKAREQQIAGHRNHATLLELLVALNPQAGG